VFFLICTHYNLEFLDIFTGDLKTSFRSFFKGQRAGDRFWISLTDAGSNGSWYWDSNGSPLSFANWRAGEPNNLGVEQCAEIRANERDWNNSNCNDANKYVCEGFLPRQ